MKVIKNVTRMGKRNINILKNKVGTKITNIKGIFKNHVECLQTFLRRTTNNSSEDIREITTEVMGVL